MSELFGPDGQRINGQFRAATQDSGILLDRLRWAKQAGIAFEGARDYYNILGYDRIITARQYRDEYARGGIAKRIVECFPKATWRGGVELYEDEDPEVSTEFEQAWDSINERLNVWSILQRADILAGLSEYSVLLLGAHGDLSTELEKGSPDKLLFLQPFFGGGGPATQSRSSVTAMGADATINEFDTDPQSPRFGEPKSYRILRTDITSPALSRPVHWSRIIHVAEGVLDDSVYGQPTLENVWNLLMDLLKTTGGGAEAFWLRAHQGIHFNFDKDFQDPGGTERASALDQLEKYKHGIDRWIRTRGADVTTLGSDVANFDAPAKAILTQIAGSKGIPMRILTGSERGELASSQDASNFDIQVQDRRTGYAGPMIVRRLVDRLIAYNYLPKPKQYEMAWPEVETMTEMEKAQGAYQWAQTNSTQGASIYTDAEIREHWHGLDPLDDEQLAEIEEANAKKVADAQAMMKATKPAEEERFPRAAQLGKDYKFSSTQVQLPKTIAERLFALGASIPTEDLAEDGCEDDAHITIKYGLHTNEAADVREVLSGIAGPVQLTLGKTAIFAADEYDVLYVTVKSPDLVRLNAKISSSLEVTDTHPKYTPHATVAYLKSGLGKKYAGNNSLEGLTATIATVLFSPVDGEPEVVDLNLRAAEDAELIRVLEAALEAGNTDVVDRVLGVVRTAGGAGSGNFGHEGRPGEVGGSGDGDSTADVVSFDGNPKNAASLAQGTVVAKSKYGQVEIQQHPDKTQYTARRRSGESLGAFKKMDSAKDALRRPVNSEDSRSGYLRPQVEWKHPEGLEKDAT